MSRVRSLLFCLALALATVPLVAAGPGPRPKSPDLEAERARIAALEQRVADLETYLATVLGYGETDEPTAEVVPEDELRLPVEVVRKHFLEKDAAHARWEDYMDIDVEYDTTPLAHPAVALKGTLEFADPFGEVQFKMTTQVSDRIEPPSKVRQKGLRFKYNQFRREHQWMHDTSPQEMVVSFRVASVIYKDGSVDEF